MEIYPGNNVKTVVDSFSLELTLTVLHVKLFFSWRGMKHSNIFLNQIQILNAKVFLYYTFILKRCNMILNQIISLNWNTSWYIKIV
jgi:hypothetical protein